MRVAFLFVLLFGAVFYTYVAFFDLSFLSRTGRLGPGFFPRIIGVFAVSLITWVIADTLRDNRAEESPSSRWGDVAPLILFAVGYAVSLRIFGGFFATLVFLAVTLTILNRGKKLQNAILSVVIPTLIYLLFDKLLNVNMPPALFVLPI
jgi:putative tricarboxylic transport membrane protein